MTATTNLPIRDPEFYARLYYANDLGRYGIRLDAFLERPAEILWAHLNYEAFRRDPCPGGHEYLPLLPAQLEIRQRLLMQEFNAAQGRRLERLGLELAEGWT
jgi:hypothetical protein